MALTPGTRLGVYEITAPIGEGGMGQVYRATDTTLGRQVAVKILPDAFAADPERLARFEREAKTLASLNHPHIAAIYAVEKSAPSTPSTNSGQASSGQASSGQAVVHALVMELVEGDDLSQRLARGAIPLDEALPIAKQIAEALEAAHEQGIIHRDLKPANIKVRADGTVKVLDFGLAKAIEGPGGSGGAGRPGGLSMSPTMMSPEQARGKTVDQRADIWAFGCVLFEMLTGQPLFRGENITDVLAAVVRTEPDLSRVPWTTRRLLRSCLEKDSQRRLHAIGDAWLLLEEAAPEPPSSHRSRVVPWLGAAAFALVATAGLWTLWRQPVADARAFQFHLDPPPGAVFLAGAQGGAALSPDGRAVVFVAAAGGSALWIRQLDSLTARELPGTSGGAYPFWSPDGRAVGFFAEGKLKKIDVSEKDVSFGEVVRVEPHDSVADFRLAPGSTGGPVFSTGGGVVGLSSVVDDEDERRRRDARIVPVDDVCEVVRSAEKAMQTAQRPVATRLPVEPLRPFPADALDAAVQRRAGNLSPYQMSSSDFDIAFLTPVLVYGAQHHTQPRVTFHWADGAAKEVWCGDYH